MAVESSPFQALSIYRMLFIVVRWIAATRAPGTAYESIKKK
jgi:hypothetical protein